MINLEEKRKHINEIMMALRKSTGEAITDMLPKFLKDYGFKVFALNQQVLIIYFPKNDLIDKQILIKHGFGKDDGVFRMYVDNPGYYTKINLLEDTDAKIYHQALTAVLTDNVFQEQLAEKLKDYDKRMIEISADLKKVETEI
jgi:hypothetical protein